MSFAASTGNSGGVKFEESSTPKRSYRNSHAATAPIIRSVGCHSHKPTNPLTSKKRKQLQDLKAREEMKAARCRLRSILLQKLTNRFKRARHRDIAKLLDEMLANKVKITATELQQLEEACRILDKAAAEMAKNSHRTKNTVKFGENDSANNHSDLSGTNGYEDENNIPISRVVKGQEWRMLMAYDMEQGEAREQRQRAEKRERELLAKKILDEQVAEKKRLAKLEKEQEKKYLDDLISDLDRAQAEKDERARRLKEKNDEQNKQWQQNIEGERNRKRAEKERQVQQEREMSEKYLRDLEEENEKNRKRKEAAAIKNQKLIEQNEADKLYKLELKQKEIDEDNRRDKEYQEKLDREQRERDEAFKKRMERLAQYAEQTDNGPIMKAKREEEARLEKIRQRDRKAREDAALAREERDKRNRFDGRKNMEQENLRQIEERKRIEESNKAADAVLAERFLAESLEAARQAQERRRLEAEARKLYGSRLIKQMETDNLTRKELDSMIERERRYNSKNLRNIVDDSKVYNKICDNLKLSLSEKLKTTVQLSKSSRR